MKNNPVVIIDTAGADPDSGTAICNGCTQLYITNLGNNTALFNGIPLRSSDSLKVSINFEYNGFGYGSYPYDATAAGAQLLIVGMKNN